MTYEFEILNLDPQPALAHREVVPVSGIPAMIDQWLPAVFKFATEHGAEPAGPPFARYHRMDEREADFEVGVPLTAPHEGGDGVQPVELPGGEVAATWHVGPYDRLGEAFSALGDWVADQGRSPAGPAWEVYWTNPAEEPDPSRWRTQVLAPIR
jgi:effector-binding domain-containing protein